MSRFDKYPSVLDLLTYAWHQIDNRLSPLLSRALLDLGLRYLATTPLEREKLQELASVSLADIHASTQEERDQIKQDRKRLERDLVALGAWRLWLAGAWVVMSLRAPWSLFTSLSLLLSLPFLLIFRVYDYLAG